MHISKDTHKEIARLLAFREGAKFANENYPGNKLFDIFCNMFEVLHFNLEDPSGDDMYLNKSLSNINLEEIKNQMLTESSTTCEKIVYHVCPVLYGLSADNGLNYDYNKRIYFNIYKRDYTNKYNSEECINEFLDIFKLVLMDLENIQSGK